MTQPEEPRLVVGVGASAGGLEAFKALLAVLPSDSGIAYLLVQHLDPKHESLLAELLAPCTGMAVRTADQDLWVEPDTIYIIRPDTALAVRDGRIELTEPTLHRGVRLPVDHLFRSLARDCRQRAVGIVLSGAGSDGSAGLRDLKASGGLTIAQDPTSSAHCGMPQSAIDTGLVDLVVQIEQIPDALERFASLPKQVRIDVSAEEVEEERAGDATSLSEENLARLAAVLEAHLNFDLRVYKPATIERRVLRRIGLSGFDDLERYFEHLRQDVSEQQTLVRDLLISVTDFFRDSEAFAALREAVIGPLIARTSGGVIRAWVPGCATGEEAYSLAIEFLEAIENHNRRISLQIFATDIDTDALTFARAAIYPPSIVERISELRLKRYFKPLDGKGYQVRPHLRDKVSFAVHDLTKDPPFSRMSLVSCRNVLIYLTSQAQRHVLKVLHFALEPGGHLFLSTSETVGQQRELFSTISKTQRIYKKVGASRPIAVQRSSSPRQSSWEAPKAIAASVSTRAPGNTELARRAAIAACMPPTVVVSDGDQIVYSHGELAPFLRLPQDDAPRLEFSAMLRPELATRARGALYKCRRSKERVSVLSFREGGVVPRVRITAYPAKGLSDDAVVLEFEEVVVDESTSPEGPEAPEQDMVIEQLEKELQATREDLRTTVEELETSNEELRSSNEESMSMNEELQSANEELEATTEELRSLNEELTTVNSQLREKVEQLEVAHDDLSNFFASTKIATIFLDERLRIKRFTPAARDLLNIDHADVGRAVGDIARELLQEDLEVVARQVLEDLATRVHEMRARDGRWISRQVLPYRTESRRIEGTVVTFVDITEAKTATERLELRKRHQTVMAKLGMLALTESDLSDFMSKVVHDVASTLDIDHTRIMEVQASGRRLLQCASTGWPPSTDSSGVEGGEVDSFGGYALQAREPVVVDDFAGEKRFKISEALLAHEFHSGIGVAIRYSDHRYGVLEAYGKERASFDADDEYFVQAVANVVGSAIGRSQARMRLALELGVAQVIADATDLDDTLELILERIAKEIGSSLIAELWWQHEGDLTRRSLHVAPPEERAHAEMQLPGDRHSRREWTIIDHVFEEQRAVWLSDLYDSEQAGQLEAARALGLVSGLALPISAGSERLGVITLLSTERMFADAEYLRSLEAIGRSIGEFIARWQATDAARDLAAITASSHDAIVSYRLDGTIDKWLAGAEALFGYTSDEMVGQSMERIVPEERRAELASVTERILRGEITEPFETERVHQSGRRLEVSVRSSPIKDRQGNVVAVSSADRDISRLKQTERKLLEADRQKDEFIAMLGHELRNPLAAIRSAASLLEMRGSASDVVDRAWPIIKRQTAHMAKLLDGLLDVSRIIRGKIELEWAVVDIGAVCRNVCDDHRQQAAELGLELRTDLPADPLWVEGDGIRLAQIVDNLLSNAIKYSRSVEGRVMLSLTRVDHHAVVRVVDTGEGIDAAFLPYVFDAFRQAKQSLDRTHGGLGLGLALTKSLVERHRGRITARSDGPGKGAEFEVELPLIESMSKSASTKAVSPSTPLEILVVEDNEDAAEMLCYLLSSVGHQVVVAHDGPSGLALATENEPDIVICDLGLPGEMSGFDVAAAIREVPSLNDTILVALSGYGRPEDKDHAKEVGFDTHLTKPVDLKALQATFASLLQRR